MSTRIYVAAPIGRARRAEHVAIELAGHGFVIVSGWHGRSTTGRDPKDHEQRSEVLAQNLAELCAADVAVVLADEGEPRCTYGEMGYAIALCKPVLFVHDSGTGRMLLDAHPLVVRLDTRITDFSELPAMVQRAAALIPRGERPTDPAPPPQMGFEEFSDLAQPRDEMPTQTDLSVPEDERLVGFARGANG